MPVWLRSTVALVAAWTIPAGISAQQSAAAASLVFDGVTVVDVEHGKLLPRRRVVIVGNRIQAVGTVAAVKTPKGARVVDARGKYLIPGLWDMHVHTPGYFAYPLLIASGVTGMRDAYSDADASTSWAPLDTMVRWQREILAGTRVGPPRQLLAGTRFFGDMDSAGVKHRIDSLKALGANFLKVYPFTFTKAAAARRAGIPFGGHVNDMSAAEASASGIRIIDHLNTSGGLDTLCAGRAASLERCQPVADQLLKNGTWWVPTLFVLGNGNSEVKHSIFARLKQRAGEFAEGVPLLHGNLLRGSAQADSLGIMRVAQQAGMPLLAGSDVVGGWGQPPGLVLHAELAMMVASGLTPLTALRSATLNPAKLLQATDSLGTVAPGKLADLVLLDADPLADITNTTTIRAVVANGRYFDHAALESSLAETRRLWKEVKEVQAKAEGKP